jgi:hypothetical protein
MGLGLRYAGIRIEKRCDWDYDKMELGLRYAGIRIRIRWDWDYDMLRLDWG